MLSPYGHKTSASEATIRLSVRSVAPTDNRRRSSIVLRMLLTAKENRGEAASEEWLDGRKKSKDDKLCSDEVRTHTAWATSDVLSPKSKVCVSIDFLQ